MRVLWLSPWLRPRARIFAEHLKLFGVEVMLVTSDLHFEADEPRDYETVLLGRPVPTADWGRCFSAYQKAARFKPDLVVTEMLRDPRWRALARLAPRVRLVHDDKPHDATHVLPWWNRLFLNGSRWDRAAAATVVFCKYVEEELVRADVVNPTVYVARLTTDLEPALTPPFENPEFRRDFLLIGRQRPYKNHEVVFAAWDAHTRGAAWRGDELIVIGDGEIPVPLPAHSRWERGAYRYRDVAHQLARAKGSIIHSRSASQSGAQILSLSLGVPTIVSTAGGLPEYQPPGFAIVGVDDVEELARSIDELSDPVVVSNQSYGASSYYRENLAPDVASARLIEIFEDVLRNTSGSG